MKKYYDSFSNQYHDTEEEARESIKDYITDIEILRFIFSHDWLVCEMLEELEKLNSELYHKIFELTAEELGNEHIKEAES